MKKKLLVIPIFAVLIISAFIIGLNVNSPQESVQSNGQINYHSSVCREIVRVDGTSEVECSENTLTDDGKDLIRDVLGTSFNSSAIEFIGLCNASATCGSASASSTTLDSEYTDSGLSRTAGTYLSLGTGNWSISNTFTATADNLLTNKTGLFNQSADGTLFAENTFTLATLQTSDTIKINWTIYVT